MRTVFLVALAAAACRSPAALERERLAQPIGRDPVEVLRTIGTAPDRDEATRLANAHVVAGG